MNVRQTQQGFGVVEVLIAVLLLAIVLGSVVTSNVALAEINSRAQVQALEASAAEGIAQMYAHALPNVGDRFTGQVTDVLPLRTLTDDERAVWQTLSYVLSRPSTDQVRIQVQRHDLPNDPNPLILEVKP